MSNRFFGALILIFVYTSLSRAGAPTFRFHLVSEPKDLNFAAQGSTSSYLQNIMSRSLFKYDDKLGIVADLAESCRWKSRTQYHCKLKISHWSDGNLIKAQDFVGNITELINPKNRFAKLNLLLSLKNAKSIIEGKSSPESIGVKALSDSEIEFSLEKDDKSFPLVLTHPFLSPKSPKPGFITSGPYYVKEWISGQKIRLQSNPYFVKTTNKSTRPPVEVLFVQEDSVALNLYEKNELSFLRRLPTQYIDKYKDKKDFFQVPVARFDYIGFGPALAAHPRLRQALATSVQYDDWKVLLKSLGRPGCFGLPKTLSPESPCLPIEIENAKKLFDKHKDASIKWELVYSRQGGDDHKKSMEWLQGQWRKHLGLDIKTRALENQSFTELLINQPPTLFRRGLGLDYPSCLQALETFTSGAQENYLRINLPKLDALVEQMRSSASESATKKLCIAGLNLLIQDYWLIPTGEIHFSLLLKPGWKGLKLNSLNHLDLTDLNFN